MKRNLIRTSMLLATCLSLGSTSIQAENLIQNGSFENFDIVKDKGKWKNVTLNSWEGQGKIWTNLLGKPSTDGDHKLSLDAGKKLDELSQIVSTVEGKKYKLSLDAYRTRIESSGFEILVDDTVIYTVTPDGKWTEYSVYFLGTGGEQVISLKELDSQNDGRGAIIDNVRLEESAELIVNGSFEDFTVNVDYGKWKEVTFDAWEGKAEVWDNRKGKRSTKGAYKVNFDFTEALDVLSQTVKTENKKEYALSLDVYVRRLKSSDLEIWVDDTKIETFSATKTWQNYTFKFYGNGKAQKIQIKEVEAQNNGFGAVIDNVSMVATGLFENLAQKFGKATQGGIPSYRYYAEASLAIDGNISTNNHTDSTASTNWWQVELPNPTLISKIMIQGHTSNQWRLEGASVYIMQEPYTGTLDESNKVATLLGNALEQVTTFTEAKSGRYLLVKATENKHLHLAEVEVYGEIPTAPIFTASNYTATIDRWKNKTESIFNIVATDYQDDILSYGIEGDVPFSIDDNGDIRVSDVLPKDVYTFDVVASDGLNETRQSVTVNVENTTTVENIFRSNDNRPELNGYLPNTYNDADTVMIIINGVSYEATVNSDGIWTLPNDTIETVLGAGTYDVTLSVNGEEIVYEDYFEVYTSMLQTSNHSLSMETLADVSVNIISHIETPLLKDEKVRGSSITLKIENAVVTLENKSYRELKSLLGKYKDENGTDVLVKLNFNENILPYSTNVLASFEHAEAMSILQTASHFDMELSFSGKDCDASTRIDRGSYCTPTTRNDEIYSDTAAQTDLSEQQVYSVAMATYNHLYNSVDGLNAMKAWVEGTTYKGLDYTGSYQSSESYTEFEDDKLAYLNENYFRVTMPNNYVKFYSMRFRYGAEGVGGVGGRVGGNLLGTRSGEGFASSWEGSLTFDNNRLLTYDTIHHEMMHAIDLSHSSGMTYGWSDSLKQVVDKLYNIGKNPVVDVPNYVFERKNLGNNQIQITVHKTSDASEDEVTIELLSGTAVTNDKYTVEQSDNDESNQLTITVNNELYTRFFIRVYGADSDELMSKIIVPSDMIINTLLTTDSNNSKEYHAITHENWKRGAKVLKLTLKTTQAEPVCKLWLGTTASIAYEVDAQKINSDHRTAIDNADWLTSKHLLGRRAVWYQYLAYDYSDGTYTSTWKNYNELVNDDSLGILCVR